MMSAGPFDFIQDKTEALPTIAAPGHYPDALQCYLLLPAPGTLQCYLRQFDFAHRSRCLCRHMLICDVLRQWRTARNEHTKVRNWGRFDDRASKRT